MTDAPEEIDITKIAREISAIDEAKRRAEVSAGMFEDHLRRFVREWTHRMPPHERDRFQMGLMYLMVDAMRHQGNTLSHGVEYFASMSMSFSATWRDRAMVPLNTGIFKEKPDGA